jgi:sialate O-acetylesterase
MKYIVGFILFAGLLFPIPGRAKIVMPDIFSDNMVLQQQTKAKLWGMAKPNAKVIIRNSWNKEIILAKADREGKWTGYVRTPRSSYTPQTLTVSDGNTLTLKNILIGEVWLCSGQSNMEIPVKGYYSNNIEHSDELITLAGKHTGIRYIIEKKDEFPQHPAWESHGKWNVNNAVNVQNVSAVGYNYALYLNNILDVPVGIIDCSYGGSTVTQWMPRSLWDSDHAGQTDPHDHFNGMLHPLIGYTIRGIAWYQGESSAYNPAPYQKLLTKMIAYWRDQWGQGDLPFLIIEIAPYEYRLDTKDKFPSKAAFLREAQFDVAQTVPRCGFVCTNDLVLPYERHNIHPRNKTDIGKRLSYLALNKVYQMPGIECESMSYKSMRIDGSRIVLSFNNLLNGINRYDGFIGFEVAGADRKFYPATKAWLTDSRNITVECDLVKDPVAVRYCFHEFQTGNVKNSWGLPLIPFRTDNWDDVY